MTEFIINTDLYYRYRTALCNSFCNCRTKTADNAVLLGCNDKSCFLSTLADKLLVKCVMAIAAPKENLEKYSNAEKSEKIAKNLAGLRVATKYVHLAERTFKELGIQIKILKLNGSIELAPVQGIADCIFDVVQTGATGILDIWQKQGSKL